MFPEEMSLVMIERWLVTDAWLVKLWQPLQLLAKKALGQPLQTSAVQTLPVVEPELLPLLPLDDASLLPVLPVEAPLPLEAVLPEDEPRLPLEAVLPADACQLRHDPALG